MTAASAATTRSASLREAAARTLVLIVSHAGRIARYPLHPGERIAIGRGRRCDVVIDHASVSRHHCTLAIGRAVTVEDVGSRNGTFVAGRRIARSEAIELQPGTAFGVGSATLLVHHAELDRAAAPAPALIAESPAMHAVVAQIDVIASSALPVLVLGETGTGKELVASALHARSPRRDRPMLRINCAAIPEPLLDAELFGHERGAFTGATSARGGLFEAADTGTLLLDELGEMPPAMQAKLLRVLETGEVIRVGSVRPRRVDVRVIAATHRELPEMVRTGALREDLFYRLDGFTIRIPPLRERVSELPALAAHLLARIRDPAPQLTAAGLDRLRAHPWPGNVRELRAVLERAAVLAGPGIAIERDHLLLDDTAPARAPGTRLTEGDVVRALAATSGNQKAAARLLGVSRPTLIKYIARFGIGRPRKR